MPTTTGTYQQIDGTPVVCFERTFPHAVPQVWDAITDPGRLAQWFPTSVEFARLQAGEPITFRFAEDAYPPMAGTFEQVQPPHLLSFTWGDDVLTFELCEQDGGAACRLSLEVALDTAGKAARDAAGWDSCLDALLRTVGGRPTEGAAGPADWQGYYDEYRRMGLPATAEIPPG